MTRPVSCCTPWGHEYQPVKIVREVRTGTDSMAQATSEIADGNMDLSRTEEQTSALEQATATSMQELAQTVKQNYDSGRQAHELAESAAKVAMKGGAVVARWCIPWRPLTALEQDCRHHWCH